MKTKIIVICCSCNKVYGEKDGKGKMGISHGLCSECFEIQMAELNGEKNEFCSQ
jgi:hypothetical protein